MTAQDILEAFAKVSIPYSGPMEAEIKKEVIKQCAIIGISKIIDELHRIRKPEYTTFILRYPSESDDAETCDGYERIEALEQLKLEIINS